MFDFVWPASSFTHLRYQLHTACEFERLSGTWQAIDLQQNKVCVVGIEYSQM